MPNASQTTLNEIDETQEPIDVPVGISSVLGSFKRGPVNNPNVVISGWPQFTRIFGGLVQGSDDAVLVQRALSRGSQLRVVNIRHYTDVTNPASITATIPTLATTKKLQYNAVLITANLLSITINGITITQLFSGNSDNTFALIVKLILQSPALAGVVSGAWYMGAGTNQIVITPETGVVLVVTSAVTLGASQAAVTVSSVTTIANSGGTALFSLVPKYPGQDYNNLQISILPASNGNANYFDIQIIHLLESSLNEVYQNLTIVGNPNVAASNYLQTITNGSQLVNPVYNDISGQAAPIRPVNTFLKFDTGTDGGAVVDTDFIGDSGAKTGVFALDPYDDFFQFGVVNALASDIAIIQALSAYSENRKDCVHFVHIDNSYKPEINVTNFRDSTLVDSTFSGFFAGGVIITDSFTLAARGISELGDVLGIAAYSQAKFGPWFSFAGKKRGVVLNALGVVNNFGLASNYAGRNLLANHQICPVINKNNVIQLSGNFTGQLDQSVLSYMNVRMMLLYLKRVLGPIFDSYIEEPNDPITWLKIFNEVKPQLKILKNKRAIADWEYQGDQFVTDPAQCTVNNPNDIDQGRYTVNLFVKSIVSLQIILVNIFLTPSGVSFEDNLSQVGDSANS